jgi:hypothetical protein
VARNIPTRRSALSRIKDQQNSTTTSENRSQIATLYHFQSQRLVINRSAAAKSAAYRTVSKILLGCIVTNSRIAPPNEKEISHPAL